MRYASFSTLQWLSLTIATISCCVSLVRGQDHTTQIAGWTELNQYWPMERGEFFIANSKGHYSVEVKLPTDPVDDFIVKLEFFYQYDRVRPSILMVLCGGEAFPIRNDYEDRNRWVIQEFHGNKDQCADQPTISISVLLHDSRSVFAWKYMKISQRGVHDDSDSFDDSSTTQLEEMITTRREPTEQHTPADQQITTIPVDLTRLPQNTQEHTTQPVADFDASNQSTDSSSNQDSNNMNVRRQLNTRRTLFCRAKSCDRSVFNVSKFRPLINGIPEGVTQQDLEGDKRMHLSIDDGHSLNFTIRSDNLETLSEVDLCVDFQLYMESDTALDFELSMGSDGFRLLENIKRESTDTTANKWDRFKRCLSEYIPKLPVSSSSSDSLMLRLVPRNMNNSKRLIFVLLDVNDVSFIRKAYPIVEYIPDLVSYTNSRNLENYWILDKDGLIKPELVLVPHNTGKRMHITKIDSHQLSFDLTSRWLKINAIDLHDNSFLFTYRIQQADWIKSLDFEFQSSTSQGNKWLSQNLYRAPDQMGENQLEVRSHRHKREANSSLIGDNPLPISAVKLRKLTTDEFRVRLRHYIKPAIADSALDGGQKELVIDSLAFGDICALGSYCKNGGVCKPTGLATAQCTCPDGFSGDHCEELHPCDAFYGDKRGNQLCESIGAKCQNSLPVFRCVWPNDQYLTCKVLYQVDSQGVSGDTTGENGALANSESDWKEKAESMSRLVVILSVFMIALLLFAVVIVGNLVGKLMKTKNNLENTQFEMNQMNKRSSTTSYNQPTASASASASSNAPTRFFTSGGQRRQSGEPTGSGLPISYNNRSFDANY